MTFQKIRKEYEQKGISIVAARQKGKYYLTIINAPYVVEGIDHEPGTCQLTGYLEVYGKDNIIDVDSMSQEVFNRYKRIYANNPVMLSYI